MDVRNAYGRWAESYDTNANPTRDLDAQVLRALPLARAGIDIVELGCGTGKNTLWLAQHARSVTAVDFSPEMLARARERAGGPNVRFVTADLRDDLPFSSASCDLVVTNLVLEHIADVGRLFLEIARILRPGGSFFFSELHPWRQWNGGQAQFTGDDGAAVRVEAYRHELPEFVNAAIACGMRLAHLDEWRDAGSDAPPRLLSARFTKPV